MTGSLTIACYTGDKVQIGEEIEVTLVEVEPNSARINFKVPKEIRITPPAKRRPISPHAAAFRRNA